MSGSGGSVRRGGEGEGVAGAVREGGGGGDEGIRGGEAEI